jgi:hypothetical protein
MQYTSFRRIKKEKRSFLKLASLYSVVVGLRFDELETIQQVLAVQIAIDVLVASTNLNLSIADILSGGSIVKVTPDVLINVSRDDVEQFFDIREEYDVAIRCNDSVVVELLRHCLFLLILLLF